MADPQAQLREKGIPVTAQRLAVMRAVSQFPHSTADVLTEAVRSSIGAVSKQAVYDTLHLLSKEGLVRPIQPAGSPTLYEDRVGDNHHHLVCRECGLTVYVDCAVGYAPCLQPSDDHGFTVDEAEVIYWGICPKCAENE